VVWDTATGKELRRWPKAGDTVVGFSPDGKTLAVGNCVGDTALWDVGTGKEGPRLSGDGAVFCRGGSVILTTSRADGTITLWGASTGEELRSFECGKEVVRLAVSPDGGAVAAGACDGTIALHEFASGKLLGRLAGHAGPINALT